MAPATRRPAVRRVVAENKPTALRFVPRLTPRIALRPPSSPPTLSRRAVLRLWEELDWFTCTYCDAAFGETVVCEVDHIVPIASGGVDEMWNLAPACAECNRSKGAADILVWLA
ncbi:HNH endonuclease [Streptomyces tubercidicus]